MLVTILGDKEYLLLFVVLHLIFFPLCYFLLKFCRHNLDRPSFTLMLLSVAYFGLIVNYFCACLFVYIDNCFRNFEG